MPNNNIDRMVNIKYAVVARLYILLNRIVFKALSISLIMIKKNDTSCKSMILRTFHTLQGYYLTAIEIT